MNVEHYQNTTAITSSLEEQSAYNVYKTNLRAEARNMESIFIFKRGENTEVTYQNVEAFEATWIQCATVYIPHNQDDFNSAAEKLLKTPAVTIVSLLKINTKFMTHFPLCRKAWSSAIYNLYD